MFWPSHRCHPLLSSFVECAVESFAVTCSLLSVCAVLQNSDPSDVIYTSGCIEQGEVWVNQNLIPVAGVFVGLALVQVQACLRI